MLRVAAASLLSLLALGVPFAAAGAELLGLRAARHDDRLRLVFELDGPVEHSVFALSEPDRLVLDLENTRLAGELPDDPGLDGVRRLRHAARNARDWRVVLDLAGPMRTKSFLLPGGEGRPYRLVLDLVPGETAAARPLKTLPKPARPRDVVIAVDAGHGGHDPGAIGRRGTYEKEVVLAVARRLARRIDAEPGMRAVLIRERDEYIGLRERMRRARAHQADLFLSIHADAFHDSRARGASVYALSLSGATSEAAAWLADRENAGELIGGVTLGDKDEVVASVLLDLSQSATIQASLEAGRRILARLAGLGPVHKDEVQQAGFIVLKSPDIPSVLVETAFLSNPEEERKLRNPDYQEKLARAILAGVRDYFEQRPPPGTLLAERRARRVADRD